MRSSRADSRPELNIKEILETKGWEAKVQETTKKAKQKYRDISEYEDAAIEDKGAKRFGKDSCGKNRDRSLPKIALKPRVGEGDTQKYKQERDN